MSNEEKPVSNQEVYAWIKAQGATQTVVHFSGGNDEGGVEQIVLKDAKSTVLRRLDEWYDDAREWDRQTRQWERTRELTLDEKVSKALCKPVYDAYGSFGGDFYVNGTVVWDGDKRSCKIDAQEQESVEHWLDFGEDDE